MTKAEIVAEILREQECLEVSVVQVIKGGVEMQGLQIGSGEIRPVVYPEMMGDNYSQIVDAIMNIYHKGTPELKVNDLTTWNNVKDSVTVHLRPATDADTVVTRGFLDLEIFCRVHVGEISAKVTWELLHDYGICEDVLFDTAINNSKFQIKSMYSTLMELAGKAEDMEMLEMLESDDYNAMFVGSNKDSYEGAGILVNDDEIKILAERLDSDLYILPSSIHEVLIKKALDGELEALRSMVKEVNSTQVAPHERLSDNVYRYSRNTGLISIA